MEVRGTQLYDDCMLAAIARVNSLHFLNRNTYKIADVRNFAGRNVLKYHHIGCSN